MDKATVDEEAMFREIAKIGVKLVDGIPLMRDMTGKKIVLMIG